MRKIIIIGLALILAAVPAADAAKGKILYVDSYHKGYPWSEGIARGILDTLNVRIDEDNGVDSSASGYELKVIRMDTKRNTSEEFKLRAAEEARAVIEEWRPDIVIASDDNASKYLIAPYFKDADLPFVFCGVNWDAAAYGFPCANVTGMIEVSLIPKLVETISSYAKGKRIGLLGADNISNRKEAENYKNKFGLVLTKEAFVKTFSEWKEEYLKMQEAVDMLIVAPPSFLQTDEDRSEAARFVRENTSIPTGCVEDWIAPFAMVGYMKDSREQGEWAARTALRILDGTSPSDIPTVTNQKGQLTLNLIIADKLDIVFAPSLLRNAVIIDE